MASPILSELLCFLTSYFGKVPKVELISIIVGFYDDEEVLAAKELLFRLAEEISPKIDGLPRLRVRKDCPNKRRLNCEDLVGLLELLDKKAVVLPQFCAVRVDRLPRISPTEVDSVRMTENITSLKEQVAALSTQLEDVKNTLALLLKSPAAAATSVTGHTRKVSELQQLLIGSWADSAADQNRSTTPPSSSEYDVNQVDEANATVAGPSAQASTPTYADMFQTKDKDGKWFVVTRNSQAPKQVTRKIIAKGKEGSNSTVSKIKSVTRDKPKVWHTFVGRLDPETSTEDLSTYLRDAGISVISCSDLPKTEEWHSKYAAFRVVVSYEHKDQMFDDELWPAGTDVRDWRFTSRSRYGDH